MLFLFIIFSIAQLLRKYEPKFNKVTKGFKIKFLICKIFQNLYLKTKTKGALTITLQKQGIINYFLRLNLYICRLLNKINQSKLNKPYKCNMN